MSNTEVYYFKGKCEWAKVYPGQEDTKFGVRYCIDFIPDDPKAFLESGVQLRPKKDKEVPTFQLRREPQKLIRGELVNFGPPAVVDKDNQPFSSPIGNGSVVTVKIAVYPTQKGKGHRLEAIRVEELVVFEGSEQAPPKGEVPKLPF